MSEEATPQNESAPETAAEEKPYNVEVSDAGTLRKKVSITIPRKLIDAKFSDIFGDLAKSAQVPGFRPGHAPRRLIEKRFAKDAASDVRNAVIGESLNWTATNVKLQTIGEPNLELDTIELPEQGDLTYSFEIEVAPEFELPNLEGIEVKQAKADITDQRVDEQIEMYRQRYVKYEATTEAAANGDVVTADVKLTGDGIEQEIKDHVLRVAPGQVEGLPLVDLTTALEGKKAGDSASVSVKAPEAHANEAWRGKDVTVAIAIKEVRRRILPDLDDAFATQAGFDNITDLKGAVRRNMEKRSEYEVRENMREQVREYLLGSAQFDLPAQMADRHANVALQRQYVSLMQMGIPQEKIMENLAELQARATEVSRRELKLQFILGKIADKMELKVEEGEVNARIAAMARENNRRPEKVRQDLEQQGALMQIEDSIREEKALNALLEKAKVTEAQPEPAKEEKK